MANTRSSNYLNHPALLWLRWVWGRWYKLLCPHDGCRISQCLGPGPRSRHLKAAILYGRISSLLQILQSACACLAPSQYKTALQSREKISNRVKIFEIGEKEQKHSLGSLPKKTQKAERKWEAVDGMLHSVQANKQYLQVIHSSEPRRGCSSLG